MEAEGHFIEIVEARRQSCQLATLGDQLLNELYRVIYRFLDRLRSICHPIIADRKDLLFDIVDEILQPPIDLRLEASFNRLGGRVDQSS